jgi:solute carrier family 35 protein F1/2
MLLDCFTIPSAMALSRLFLGVRYSAVHLLGIVICVCGLIVVVVSDLQDDVAAGSSSAGQQQQFVGDMMCVAGSLIYASSNVLQEHLVRRGRREDYMGNLGVCGLSLAGLLFLLTDLSRMLDTSPWTSAGSVLALLGFVGCLFAMYTQTSSFLEKSDAVVFNLSLLTSDVYAVVFSFFFYGRLVPWPYFLSYALVCLGLSMYYSSPPLAESETAASAAASAVAAAESQHTWNPLAATPPDHSAVQ